MPSLKTVTESNCSAFESEDEASSNENDVEQLSAPVMGGEGGEEGIGASVGTDIVEGTGEANGSDSSGGAHPLTAANLQALGTTAEELREFHLDSVELETIRLDDDALARVQSLQRVWHAYSDSAVPLTTHPAEGSSHRLAMRGYVVAEESRNIVDSLAPREFYDRIYAMAAAFPHIKVRYEHHADSGASEVRPAERV